MCVLLAGKAVYKKARKVRQRSVFLTVYIPIEQGVLGSNGMQVQCTIVTILPERFTVLIPANFYVLYVYYLLTLTKQEIES